MLKVEIGKPEKRFPGGVSGKISTNIFFCTIENIPAEPTEVILIDNKGRKKMKAKISSGQDGIHCVVQPYNNNIYIAFWIREIIGLNKTHEAKGVYSKDPRRPCDWTGTFTFS